MTYGFETTTDEVIDGVDLTGKIAVVTGASAGIGVETARALAAAGARVVLAARNAERTEAAAESIRERVPGAELEVGTLDLTSLDSVRAFAAWYLERHDELQLLVNNAGVMYTPFERTADGFEMQFGTNHVGHFLLTCLLVPALLAGAPSRVVNLSSGGHMGSDIVWDDPELRAARVRQVRGLRPVEDGQHPLQRRARPPPGRSRRARLRGAPGDDRHRARPVHDPRRHGRVAGARQARPEWRHAPTQEHSSRVPPPRCGRRPIAGLDDQGGTYLADCQVTDQHAPWARDRGSAPRLWTLSENLVGEEFPARIERACSAPTPGDDAASVRTS